MARTNQWNVTQKLRVGLLLATVMGLGIGSMVYGSPKVPGAERAGTPEILAGRVLLSELNCTACHKAEGPVEAGLASKGAPDLSKMGGRLRVDALTKHLAEPSGAKGNSTMPDLLGGLQQAERQQAAEALAHYVASQAAGDAVRSGRGSVGKGKELYHKIGCVACHGAYPAAEGAAASAGSLPLSGLNEKYGLTGLPGLAAFLKDPLASRPGGRMPNMKLSSGEATDLAIFLLGAGAPANGGAAAGLRAADKVEDAQPGVAYRYYHGSWSQLPDFEKLKPQAEGVMKKIGLTPRKKDDGFAFTYSGYLQIPQAGTWTFTTASDDGTQLSIGGEVVVSNDGIHATASASGSIDLAKGLHSFTLLYFEGAGEEVLNFLWEGPGTGRGAVPAAALFHSKADPYNQNVKQAVPPTNAAIKPELAAKGKQLFATLGCAACHSQGGQKMPMEGARPLAVVAGSMGGCLAENPAGKAARYGLTADQRKALGKAISDQAELGRLSAADRVELRMHQLNCLACHTRGGKGGPEDAERKFFVTTTELDLGDEGRIPPHLNGAGFKLKKDYLDGVLIRGATARPYMATRMPQFGANNLSSMTEDLMAVDGAKAEAAEPKADKAMEEAGRLLVGVKGLSCVACHTFGEHKSLGIPAVNLTQVSGRLRKEWFKGYLLDPQSLRPGTRMPPFWPGGQSLRKDILNGDTDRQIEAIWAYLQKGDKARTPEGLTQAKLELLPPPGEAIIYRNFIQGAGTRAIGVGYPSRIHLAFDANNMRLAMIWQGGFIDAHRHWTGRGEGFQGPLGSDVRNFPDGQALAVLEKADEAWPAKKDRATGHRFRGYELDEARKPTFNYEFNSIAIKDKFTDVATGPTAYFKRVLTLSSAESTQNLYMRLAAGKAIEEKTPGQYLVDGELLIQLDKQSKGLIRKAAGGLELLAPITFTDHRATLEVNYLWP